MPFTRTRLTSWLGLSLWLGLAAGSSFAATDAEIAAAITNLGATDYQAREAASQTLWAAGSAAVAALQQASQSDDPEVAQRARELLENIKYGIQPDTPEELRELLRRYPNASLPAKQGIVRELYTQGPAGRRYVELLARAEPDLEARLMIFQPLLQLVDWEPLAEEGEIADEVIERMVAEIKFWTHIFPEDITLPLGGIRRLDELGKKPVADQVFAEALKVQQATCARQADQAEAHNNLAWLCAVARRELDLGLIHAERAVKLAPSQAAYVDTLAELQFQKGNTDRALQLIKTAIQLDPDTDYFRDQLKRFEAGDRSVPPPEPL